MKSISKLQNATNGILSLFALGSALTLLFFSSGASAQGSSVTMRVEPATATQKYATSFSVAIYVDSGAESVNAVEVDLSYPSNLLEFVSFDATSTEFEIEAPGKSGTGGAITLTRASATSHSGSSILVTKLNFKTKSTSGSAALGFGANSKVVRVSDITDVLSSTSGATITIKAPTTNTPKPDTGTPSTPSDTPSTDKPATNNGGTTTPDTTPDDTTDDGDTPTSNNGSKDDTKNDTTDSDSKDVSQSATEENRENRDEKNNSVTTIVGAVAAGIATLALLGLGTRALLNKRAHQKEGKKQVAQVGIIHGKADSPAAQVGPTVIYPEGSSISQPPEPNDTNQPN